MNSLKSNIRIKNGSLLLSIALLFICNLAKSQTNPPFRFTFVTSPQLNWFSSDKSSVDPGDMKPGYNFGVNADLFLGSNKYSFATGVTISQINSSLTYRENVIIGNQDFPGGSSLDYELKFVEVPAALRLRTNQFHRMIYYAQFGLFTLINVSASGKSDNMALDGENISEEIRLFNAGFTVGGGAEYDLGGNNALTFGLIYNNGFSDLTTNDLNENVFLRNLRLRLGIIF